MKTLKPYIQSGSLTFIHTEYALLLAVHFNYLPSHTEVAWLRWTVFNIKISENLNHLFMNFNQVYF